jgi:hypothetical protein
MNRLVQAALLVAVAGLTGVSTVTSGHEDAVAQATRTLRVQKVTPTAVHPAHDFHILINPAPPFPVVSSVGANASVGTVQAITIGLGEISVAEGPQQDGWQRGGYALLPDPAGVAQCSANLSFGLDYSQILVPAGTANYLVCVRNIFQVPDPGLTSVELMDFTLTSAAFSVGVTNFGPASIEPRWKIEAWASRDTTFDPGVDVAIGDWMLEPWPPLLAGGKLQDQFEGSMAANSFLSLPFLIVRLVTGLPETNLANNQLAIALPIGPVFRAYLPALAYGGSCTDCPLEAQPPSLGLLVLEVDHATRTLHLGGGDTRQPSTPFDFDWGDGSVTQGFFPLTHSYSASGRYTVRVTAHYANGTVGYALVVVDI